MTIPKRPSKTPAGFAPPPIPLERPEAKELEKDDYVSLKLKTVPRSSTSAEYSLNVPYFRSGTPEEWLKFMTNMERVFIGQNLSTGAHKFSMARRLLVGESLSHFEKKAESFVTVQGEGENQVETCNETQENFDKCIQAVTMTVFPKKSLMTQKRYMRRIMRKPKDMKTRDYCARYSEINKYLESFPPFKGKNQVIPNDEILEHLEFAIPNSWQKQMVLQGFNTLERTMEDFIEFCERLEFSESIYDSSHSHTGQKARAKSGDEKSDSKVSAEKGHSKKRKTQFYCLYHGENTTHDTNDCKVLKAQAEKMASAHSNLNKGKYSKNRTQSGESKKEFQSFKTEIVRSVLKSLNSAQGSSKKRKVTEMDHFNMEQFRNLTVSSDSESKSDDSGSDNDSSS